MRESPNQTRRATPGGPLRSNRALLARRACALRWPVKTALLLSLLIGLPLAHSQGTIRFTNVGLDASVRNATGELVPAGFAHTAELLTGPAPGSLAPVSGTEWFTSPGVFGGPDSVRVLDGLPPGSHPWFQIRCWRLAGEVWIPENPPPYVEIGESEVFQFDLAGPGLGETVDDAPVLAGMTPFQLHQTFTLAVGMESDHVVLRWEAIAGGWWSLPPLDLERATSLNGPWTVQTNAVSPYSEPVSGKGPAYFRIVIR